jgi:hypothetical protein
MQRFDLSQSASWPDSEEKATKPSSYPFRSESSDFVLLGFFAFSLWGTGGFS